MRKVIGLTPADRMERKDNQDWLQNALEQHLQKLMDQGNWAVVKLTMFLLIYWLVLFPLVPNMVGLEAMGVFYRYTSGRSTSCLQSWEILS
ncbi:hypothetical protein TanjilG_30510 [Lupinus angustifolius]|uniref:DUF7745 domain-containing protein n=1 Tax=Lupinus angustifolius TaxID=3871 RepID=A0A1J7GW52_LUPAN|nr:hypothetical protein TanjilG_30510 [Lupinus angustifolius]